MSVDNLAGAQRSTLSTAEPDNPLVTRGSLRGEQQPKGTERSTTNLKHVTIHRTGVAPIPTSDDGVYEYVDETATDGVTYYCRIFTDELYGPVGAHPTGGDAVPLPGTNEQTISDASVASHDRVLLMRRQPMRVTSTGFQALGMQSITAVPLVSLPPLVESSTRDAQLPTGC